MRVATRLMIIVIVIAASSTACSEEHERRATRDPLPTPQVTQPDDNVYVHGNARLDGRAFDASFIGAVVMDHGLVTPCNAMIPKIVGGRFALVVYGAQTSAGCGRVGARVALWTYSGAEQLFSTTAFAWPTGPTMNVAPDFSTADPSGAAPTLLELSGEAIGADGNRVPAGTRVEAFVGNTRCGVASVRAGVFDGYILHVVGPDSVPGCRAGATITFRIGGKPTVETRANGGVAPHSFDLTVR